MQLNSTSIENLQALLNIAQVAEIDNVIIEDGRIRGISEDKSVVLFAENNIPDFGFPRVGLNRLSTLASRLAMAKSVNNVIIDSKKGKSDEEVGLLDISWAGAKVQYRCADPSTIRAPKNVRDTDTWEITLASSKIPTIVTALKSMGAKRVNLNTRTGNEVYLELVEAASNDVFTLEIAEGANYLKEGTPKSKVWVNVYPANQLISILRAAAEGQEFVKFIIGENGTLQVMLNQSYKLVVVSLTDSH